MVNYKYNAWGDCKIEYPEDATAQERSVGASNPFRYRGYYYCSELGLYYLKSRFYDPSIGRFISADSLDYLDPHTVGGVNLFAYCNNNPVMNVDPTGRFAISLTLLGFVLGATIGATIGGVASYSIAKSNENTGWGLFAKTVLGTLGGAIIGGVLGATAGAIATKATGILGFSIVKGNVFVVTQTMVLGHMGYSTLATTLGYGYYQISDNLYNSMTVAQRWEMNAQFLIDCARLGANFLVEPTRVLAPQGSRMGSWLYHEIAFLLEKGYRWLEDLSALVK